VANEFRAPNAATLREQFALAFTNRRIVYAGELSRHTTARREFPKLVVAIRAAAEQLRSFYAEGTKSCILDLLSIPSGGPELAAGLKGTLQAWQKAFACGDLAGYGMGGAHVRCFQPSGRALCAPLTEPVVSACW